MVSSCSVKVINNTLEWNLKANIAVGGKNSGNTLISQNKILKSIQEGIFVVDGEDQMVIVDNIVEENKDGITMFNSQGQVKNNSISQN